VSGGGPPLKFHETRDNLRLAEKGSTTAAEQLSELTAE
jgi:hypothetical protein